MRVLSVHKIEEGGLVVRGGVEFRWVVISRFFEDDYVPFELEVGIGGIGGVLVGTVIRGSRRQVWRGGGEVVLELIVEMGGGKGWREALVLVVYIVVAVHSGGGMWSSVTCVLSLTPSAGCVLEIGMMKIGGKKKKGWTEKSERDLKLRPPSQISAARAKGTAADCWLNRLWSAQSVDGLFHQNRCWRDIFVCSRDSRTLHGSTRRSPPHPSDSRTRIYSSHIPTSLGSRGFSSNFSMTC